MIGGKIMEGLPDQKTLYISNVEPWMTEGFLKNIFAQVCKYFYFIFSLLISEMSLLNKQRLTMAFTNPILIYLTQQEINLIF